jgi:hypothetical protein
MSQEIVGPLTVTSPLGVEGGSLELGATVGATPETPYVDFHFGLGAAQDFNVRLINPANNHLDVVTEAGGPVLSVHADKVGIGTTSPAAKLVVNEPAGGAEVRVDGNNGLIGLFLGADAAQPWVGTRTNHDLRLLANNAERVRVQANGNVGIGTPAPDTRLNVNSSAPNSQAVLAVSNGNADTRLALWSGFNAGANPPAILYTHDLRFGTVAAPNVAAGSGFSEAMRVTSNGNVGIGTPSPAGRLEVMGNWTGAEGALRLTGDKPTVKFSGGALSGNQSWILHLGGNGPGNLEFYRGTGPSQWRDVMVLTRTGNVGVGMTNPRTQLHVLGRISTGLDFTSAGAVTFFPPDGFAWFHIDNGPSGGRPIGRLRISHGNSPGNFELISILQNGNVGVGTASPVYKLDVAGSAHATSFPTSSDERFKREVRPLTQVLEKLDKIRGISFEWNERYASLGRATGHREIGVIAQEVEAVFPELVTSWGDARYRAIDYGRLTAVLVEAIKQLKEEIEALKHSIQAR